MNSASPNIINRLLSKFCHPDLWESIEGDLSELFLIDIKRKGKRKAQINYLLNALAFLRYHRLRKNKNSKTQTNMSLIKNYLKVSVRDLKRNKVFTAINLTGLITGMTASLLILQYVLFETSFDNYHEDADRIYRVINDRYQNGELIQHGQITYSAIGLTMEADFPEVEASTRMLPNGRSYITYNDEQYLSNNLLIADEHFPTFFSIDFIAGQREQSLDATRKIVLTRVLAERLVGPEGDLASLIEQSLYLDDENPYKITGIVENPPLNSHLQYDAVSSYKTFVADVGERGDSSWDWSDFYHYVKLKQGVNVSSMDDKLTDFGVRYFKEGEVSGSDEKFFLQPLKEAHLDNSMEYEIGDVTNGRVVWMMLSIAIFIVLIAWINYINLNTSRAIQRAKEVGIRKSVGAQKGQIIWQFFTETLLLNFFSLLISIGAVSLLQSTFNTLTALDLSLMTLVTAQIWGMPFPILFFSFLLLALILVALYPALLVTRFSTQDILKGSFRLKGEIVWLKKGMVVFQFSVAVILITAAIAIGKQVDFMINEDLGIDYDNTMVIYGPGQSEFDSTFIGRIDRFKNEVKTLSGVEMATASNRVLGTRMGRVFSIKSSSNPEAKNLTANFIQADHDFAEVYNISILAGRDFNSTDHHLQGARVKNIMVNQSALDLLKFSSSQEAVGKSVNFWNKDWTIIGVVNDFHQLSLHEKISPMFLIPYLSTYHNFSLKLSTAPTESLIATIEKKYQSLFPGNFFDYYYLEDQVAQLYNDDIRVGKISKVFTILSILIAVLGLYGLVMMTLLRKTREIGMRKVLGANLGELLLSISKEFILLVLIAIAVGAPLSYFAVLEWKAGFAYSADMGFGLILGASSILLLISILTIVFQTKRISRNNPVESLRCE